MAEIRETEISRSVIRPLVVGTDPFPGEGLPSVLVRACEVNVFTKTSHLLNLIGLRTAASESVPFTHAGAAPAIAELLGTTTDEIENRMHPATQDDFGRSTISWFGSSIERWHIDARSRRFAPRSLEQQAHFPAIWAVRLLDYCPVTLELLLSQCPQCSRRLTWRACRSLLKCENCRASLLGAETHTLPAQLHDGARLGAALVSPIESDRRSALSSLPQPFSTWAPADALVGLLTLGEAQISLEPLSVAIGTTSAAAKITAGIKFAEDWPHSLARFVKESMARGNTTSVRSGLGPLGKLFTSSAKRTPIRDLIRSTISTSLGDAVVPAKIFPGARVGGSCRTGMVSALEASKQLGITLKTLRRLEGPSEAFIGRHNVHGGVTLYDKAAISRLREVLDRSVTPRICTRQLGIPTYCLEAFVSAGLIEVSTNRDVEIVRGTKLITKASIAALRESCRMKGEKIEGGVTLREALRRKGAPQAWITAFESILAGRIQHQLIGDDEAALSDALVVDGTALARQVSHRAKGSDISGIDISCQTAASLIGATPMFVSSALKVGLIAGETRGRDYSIPLAQVLEFQRDFVLAEELREIVGGHQRSVSSRLRKAGLKPVTTINRTTVWKRGDIEKHLQARKRKQRPDASYASQTCAVSAS